jgi:CBS domain-containing protein
MRTWRVSDVMTMDVAAVGAQTPYREIIDVVTARRISAVPVVDADRRVLGVVSEADLLHKVELIGEPNQRRIFASRRQRAAQRKAEAGVAQELMTTPAVTVYGHTALVAAARTMEREDIKRLPVVDDLGRLVGIVTRGDLLKVHLRPDAEIRADVVREVLGKVLSIEEGKVEVTVVGGVVQLAGRIDRRSSAQLALKLAAQVSGVVEVVDELDYEFDDTVLAGRPAFLARTTGVS